MVLRFFDRIFEDITRHKPEYSNKEDALLVMFVSIGGMSSLGTLLWIGSAVGFSGFFGILLLAVIFGIGIPLLGIIIHSFVAATTGRSIENS